LVVISLGQLADSSFARLKRSVQDSVQKQNDSLGLSKVI